MNEIEKAIGIIFNLMPEDEEESDAFSCALSALQERIDRENGCKFCTKYDIEDLVCYIPLDNGSSIDAYTNFCPMCGRPLKTAMPGEEV